MDVIGLINKTGDSDYETEVDAEGRKAVEKYIRDNWEYQGEMDEYGEDMMAKLADVPDDPEWEIAIISVSYHNDMLRQLLKEERIAGRVEFIMQDEAL
jgi:hypothetical protein